MTLGDALVRPLLLRCDPETAHRAALALMRFGPVRPPHPDDPALAARAFGLAFPNPVGLAAGFDKSGTLGRVACRHGFGFTEVGTVTPQAQDGNARPRVFRLSADRGVINRYGFNNEGHEAVLKRLRDERRTGLLGINLGANKDAADRTADYVAGITCLVGTADYVALNVSSPNTPGLRDLQAASALDDLLARAVEARDAASGPHGRTPIVLKIAPDLNLRDLDDIVAVATRRGIDGLVVSNTTISRPAGLRDGSARQAGGLSGRPLFELSTRMLAEAYLRVGGRMPLVGVGGIDTPERALAKIEAGATLLQLYSGLIYEGLGLVDAIKRHLVRTLEQEGETLAGLVGRRARDWCRNGPAIA